MNILPRIKTPAVYCIVNLTTSKIYIGSTTNATRRYYMHVHQLKNGNHPVPALQSDYIITGPDNFVFRVIERCARTDLSIREQYWMDRTECFDSTKGYNHCAYAGNPFSRENRTDIHDTRSCFIIGDTYNQSKQKRYRMRFVSDLIIEVGLRQQKFMRHCAWVAAKWPHESRDYDKAWSFYRDNEPE